MNNSLLTILLLIAFVAIFSSCKKDNEVTPPPDDQNQKYTWQPTGLSNGTVRALVVNNVGNVFASVDGDGVYRTTDNGSTWTKPLNGPFQSSVGSGYAECFTIDGNTIWAGTNGSGIFRSTDEGASWVEVNLGQSVGSVYAIRYGAPDYNGTRTLFCGSTNGIFRYDEINGWTQVESNSTNTLLTVTQRYDGKGIYAGGSYQPDGYFGIIMWSSNNGISWFKTAIRGIVKALVENSKGELFAATIVCPSGGSVYGIFKNDIYGSWYSWEGCYNGLMDSDFNFESIVVTLDDHLYIGSISSGVYRSINSGDSWVKINDGLTDQHIHALAINPAGYIYAGTKAGVFRCNF